MKQRVVNCASEYDPMPSALMISPSSGNLRPNGRSMELGRQLRRPLLRAREDGKRWGLSQSRRWTPAARPTPSFPRPWRQWPTWTPVGLVGATALVDVAVRCPPCGSRQRQHPARSSIRMTVWACHRAPVGVGMSRAVNCTAICRADKPPRFNSASRGASWREVNYLPY